MRALILSMIFIFSFTALCAQGVAATPEYIKELTSSWTGERFPDGRPKVSDALLKRMKNIQIEEAWGYLRGKGYHNQYEGEWEILHPDSVMTGRVVTVQYMPLRPDYQQLIKIKGAKENRDTIGGSNSWPIQMLKSGDVYVADGYNRIVDGTLIGSNLGMPYTPIPKTDIYFTAVYAMWPDFWKLKASMDGTRARTLLFWRNKCSPVSMPRSVWAGPLYCRAMWSWPTATALFSSQRTLRTIWCFLLR
jgi:hypothetical protein